MYLITEWFGTFLCDKEGIKDKILFPKDKKEIAKRLIKIDNKSLLTEEKKIIKGFKVKVNEKRLDIIGDYEPDDLFFKEFIINPLDFNYSLDLLHESMIIFVESKVSKKLSSEDLHLIQMVNFLDELIQTANLFSERIENWSLIPNSKNKVKSVENVLSSIKKEIKKLENQIDLLMEKIAPNISSVVGSLIGARLISFAGGLEKIAMLPASTIQILGAEKALFRFKKEGGKPPKHGVIFQHNLINKSPRKIRGKIARILSTKISIASRADFFTKNDISKELLEDLKIKLKEIRNQ